jgi:alpha-beta hydrolase superfamily lysophospholipase
MTLARVFLTLSGFISVVNGLIELGPETGGPVKAAGVALILVGLFTWWLVRRLRRPSDHAASLALGVAIALAAVRVWQYELVHAPTILAAVLLPLVAWLRVRSAAGTPPAAPRRRGIAALGAVGITASILAVATGGALAAALAPCSLPQASSPGLNSTSASTVSASPTGYLAATDGAKLAYYASVPADPVASLVFYHGSGANSRAGYLGLGRSLASKYHIATYLFDMRGHGASSGPRGDAPSRKQMFEDTRTEVSFVHRAQAGRPEFVGGHSAGAGLVLNSSSLIDREVAGYAFLAPDFGLHSGTERESNGSNFATICQAPLIADVVTNGLVDAHTYAVGFAYTKQEVASSGLVDRYTTTMAIAQDASRSASILAGIHKPVGVWVGSSDEVFTASKVVAYAKKAPQATAQLVPGADHLGVIDASVDYLGPWLVSAAKH